MTARTLLVLTILIATLDDSPAPGQTSTAKLAVAGGAFPKEIDDRGFHLVIYQPQVDSWKKDRLEARAAVTASRSGATEEAFGIVTLTARTDVDKEARTVWFEDLKVTSASFPGVKPEQGDLEQAVRDSLPSWPKTIGPTDYSPTWRWATRRLQSILARSKPTLLASFLAGRPQFWF